MADLVLLLLLQNLNFVVEWDPQLSGSHLTHYQSPGPGLTELMGNVPQNHYEVNQQVTDLWTE